MLIIIIFFFLNTFKLLFIIFLMHLIKMLLLLKCVTWKLITSEICQLRGIYFTVFDDLSFLLGNK